jgi:hypothetical protein
VEIRVEFEISRAEWETNFIINPQAPGGFSIAYFHLKSFIPNTASYSAKTLVGVVVHVSQLLLHYPTMTVNHVFVRVSHVKMPAMRAFYRSVLKPLGYSELITVSENYIGFGSDYPYLWLKVLPEGKESVPTHIALDAPGM